MSGGRWDYQDMRLVEMGEDLQRFPTILRALSDAFHEIDWAESGDTDRESAEPKVYDILLKLANEIFARDRR